MTTLLCSIVIASAPRCSSDAARISLLSPVSLPQGGVAAVEGIEALAANAAKAMSDEVPPTAKKDD